MQQENKLRSMIDRASTKCKLMPVNHSFNTNLLQNMKRSSIIAKGIANWMKKSLINQT